MAKDKSYVVGFDLGGTKMIAAVVDAGSRIIAAERAKTPAEQGIGKLFEQMCALIRRAVEQAGIAVSDLAGIGVAVPGPVDWAKGVVLQLTNFGISDYPLRDKLQKEFGVPVAVDNDVNAGTWGEYVLGAAKGVRDLVGVFVGTGIGGGLILDGRLYRGARGGAGEIGHMVIREGGALCGCGQLGCVEALSSRLAMAKDAVALSSSGKLGGAAAGAGTDLKKFKSSFFERALQDGDPAITALVRRSAENMGIALANLVNLLNPEAIVLGGGLISRIGPFYRDAAERSMRQRAIPLMVKDVKLLLSALGDDAVPLGAAAIARGAA